MSVACVYLDNRYRLHLKLMIPRHDERLSMLLSSKHMACSHNRFICWVFSVFASKLPLSWLWDDMISADLPNHDFVEQLDKDLSVANTDGI